MKQNSILQNPIVQTNIGGLTLKRRKAITMASKIYGYKNTGEFIWELIKGTDEITKAERIIDEHEHGEKNGNRDDNEIKKLSP